MQAPDFDTAANRELLQQSIKQTDRLAALIHDLLDVTKMEQGQLQYRFEIVPLAQLVDSLVRGMALAYPTHKFVMDIQNQASVQADPLRIEQALTNIIVNATKYSPASTTITIELSNKDDYAMIAISDEGIGITPEQQKHLFDLYYRAPTVNHVKGLGIGLPLSYGIIKAHNGDIKVSSTAGKGSTFTVVLPISR